MYKSKTIAVVIPAYNEEKLVGRTVSSIPDFIDFIIVVNDCSKDGTIRVVTDAGARPLASVEKGEKGKSVAETGKRLFLLNHEKNQGVGGAIVSGYLWCRNNDVDVAVVMAGDAQMDPADLESIIGPVAQGEYDYCKGNRLFTGEAWKKIPKIRYLGNSVLSFMTKIASGYWHVADSQSGYTAINAKMLKLIDWDRTYKRYGCPNDYLVRLNVCNARVKDVPVKPLYGIGEKSGINIVTVIPKISLLLVKLFWWRMLNKYVIRDFHPLVLFYSISLLLTFFGTGFGLYLLWYRFAMGPVVATSVLFAVFLMIMGVQFGLFAMLFDMDNSKTLK
jgi:glycosyltransferase involved in cell wall biosynthesis